MTCWPGIRFGGKQDGILTFVFRTDVNPHPRPPPRYDTTSKHLHDKEEWSPFEVEEGEEEDFGGQRRWPYIHILPPGDRDHDFDQGHSFDYDGKSAKDKVTYIFPPDDHQLEVSWPSSSDEMMMMMTNTTEPRREYVRRKAAGRKNIGKSRQPQRANCIIVESVHPKTWKE